VITTYEERLDNDLNWALDEAERFFQGRSFLHKALRRLTARLHQCGIAHALAGDMAYFCHGVRRCEDRLDVLVTAAGLNEIGSRLDGWGYVPLGKTGRSVRDDEFRIRISFVVTSEYPGSGTASPVSFPNPESVAVERAGISLLPLPTLIELTLAATMSEPGRFGDLAAVVESIRRLRLPRDFAARLNPYVRPKFDELWDAVQEPSALE
jgi:hypothetical protein